MANFFNLVLDTTGPSNVRAVINGGAAFTTSDLVTVGITTGDTTTANYQMKIWGDVDTAHSTDIQATEALSKWITLSSSKQVKLKTGDGAKSISVKLRDDVYNESDVAVDSITLDTSKPVVTVTNPDVSKVSKIAGKNVASFTFSVDQKFIEYKVKVVSASGSAENTGYQIPTTNGSTNVSGTKADGFPATTPISVTINGADLELASAGDGSKIIKVFTKDEAGNWSV